MSDPLPPLPPRLFTKAAAAAYCTITEGGFDDWVRRGLVPKAMPGTRRWDKVALDLALDRLSGIDRSKPAAETPESLLAKFHANRAAREAAKAARPVTPPITKRRGVNRDRT